MTAMTQTRRGFLGTLGAAIATLVANPRLLLEPRKVAQRWTELRDIGPEIYVGDINDLLSDPVIRVRVKSGNMIYGLKKVHFNKDDFAQVVIHHGPDDDTAKGGH